MKELITEAINHKAIDNHPYLVALQNGDFKNPFLVLRDFASQYGHYSAWFPRYLTATISKLERPDHSKALIHNLSEESGHMEEADLESLRAVGIKDDWIHRIPHPVLFKRFQDAMGVSQNNEPGLEVKIWRETFLWLVTSGAPCMALGAIGLGTEYIVKYIYKYILESIKNNTNLTLYDYVFFPMHMEVDDQHSQDLMKIGEDLIQESKLHESDFKHGMRIALNARASFWDDMYVRATLLDQSLELKR